MVGRTLKKIEGGLRLIGSAIPFCPSVSKLSLLELDKAAAPEAPLLHRLGSMKRVRLRFYE